jgi:acetylornithine deacetylase/succinyl-diaminopimelate desuccinylase-like protein
MAAGGDNPAATIRRWVASELGGAAQRDAAGRPVVPPELIGRWFEARRARVAAEVEEIAAAPGGYGAEWAKLAPLVDGLRALCAHRPALPVQARGVGELQLEGASERTGEVLKLAAELVRIPSVTNCAEERIDQVFACAGFITEILRRAGLEVRLFDRGRYPAVLASFAGGPGAAVTLCGHFDVVRPEPDDRQFEPRVEGEYLWGRGAADMKTVVASDMVWMTRRAAAGPPFPTLNLLLVGNEENGEGEPFGTPHVLAAEALQRGWSPQLLVVGERTGERGSELFGAVCPESRGILRLRIEARGACGHTGTAGGPADLLDRLIEVRAVLGSVFARHLTLSSIDGWESSTRFPFLSVGEAGVYNITAGTGVLGVEVRPIPGDDLEGLLAEVRALCLELGLAATVELMEPGVACPPDNPWLHHLLAAVAEVSGSPAVVGRKLPGSSARFAPGGNQVVWGQTGIGPHSRDERHFIPSIEPYLRVLDAFAARLGDA